MDKRPALLAYLEEFGYDTSDIPEEGYSEEDILANDETYNEEATVQGAKNLAGIIYWVENGRTNLPNSEWGSRYYQAQ